MAQFEKGMLFPDLSFATYSGRTDSVGEAVKNARHTVFWVMRFIGCRFCQWDLEQLKEKYRAFQEAGVSVYAVLQSAPQSIAEIRGGETYPYEIICDPDCRFYDSLDVKATATKADRMPKDEESKARYAAKRLVVDACNFTKKTDEGRAEQLNALFILDADRRIEYARYAQHSVDIPEIDELLDILKKL